MDFRVGCCRCLNDESINATGAYIGAGRGVEIFDILEVKVTFACRINGNQGNFFNLIALQTDPQD